MRSEAGTLPPTQKTAAGSFPAARDHRGGSSCDSQECHRLTASTPESRGLTSLPPKGTAEGRGREKQRGGEGEREGGEVEGRGP